jgi:hypothetical protein
MSECGPPCERPRHDEAGVRFEPQNAKTSAETEVLTVTQLATEQSFIMLPKFISQSNARTRGAVRVLSELRRRWHSTPPVLRPALDPQNLFFAISPTEFAALHSAKLWPLPHAIRDWLWLPPARDCRHTLPCIGVLLQMAQTFLAGTRT